MRSRQELIAVYKKHGRSQQDAMARADAVLDAHDNANPRRVAAQAARDLMKSVKNNPGALAALYQWNASLKRWERSPS